LVRCRLPRIRDEIEAVFPELFAKFNERIRHPGGFHLMVPPRERIWATPTGRANFFVFSGLGEDEAATDPDMLRLATLRNHDQYNTTIYLLDDRYRGVFGGRMVVFMNEADMQARGIAEGDMVEIESLADDTRRIVGGFWVKPHPIAVGSVGAYSPETNPLLPLAFHDQKSGTPAAKSIPVLVRRKHATAAAYAMSAAALQALPPPLRAVARQTWREQPVPPTPRLLAEEVAVAANYDGTTHAVLMMTPDDLDDFAVGFSLTEGIIRDPGEIAELEMYGCPDGIVLRMWLIGDRSDAFAARRRRFIGPAGCGMCGLESLAEANRAIPAVSSDLRVVRSEIMEAVAALPRAQAPNPLGPCRGILAGGP